LRHLSAGYVHQRLVREPIVDIDDHARRLAWAGVVPSLTHYNACAQVFANPDGGAKVV
jgi:hypothetical protein